MDTSIIENNVNENEQNIIATEASVDETPAQERAPSSQQIEELQEEVRASEPAPREEEKITSLVESMNKSILDNLIASQESFLDLKNEIRETHELNDEEDYEILNKNGFLKLLGLIFKIFYSLTY